MGVIPGWGTGILCTTRHRRGKQNKIVGWRYWLNGREFEQTLGDGEGQGSLACCSPWGCKELDRTEQLNRNNNIKIHEKIIKEAESASRHLNEHFLKANSLSSIHSFLLERNSLLELSFALTVSTNHGRCSYLDLQIRMADYKTQFYMRKLNICRFWYSWGLWNQQPVDTERWLYSYLPDHPSHSALNAFQFSVTFLNHGMKN